MRQNALLWIMKQIRNRFPGVLIMTVAQVGHSLFGVLFALGSRAVIDSAVSGDTQRFAAACLDQALIIFGILFCLAVSRHLRERLNADLERDWKQRLLHGLLHGDYAQVSAYHSAELLNRMNNDVAKVNEGVLTVLPSAAALVTRLAAAVMVLGTLDRSFTVAAAALGCLMIAVTTLLRRKLKNLNKQVSEHDGKVSGYLQEVMEKLLLVQAMDVSGEVEKRSDGFLEDRYQIQRKRKNISLLANFCVSLLRYGAGFLALCWCAGKLMQGQMSFGSLTAMIQLVNQLQAPFMNLSGVMPKYIAMVASAERLMELDHIQGEQAPATENYRMLYQEMKTIRFENVSFSYGQDDILKKAEFEIPKGAFAVLMGPSGTGKSTLLKLLLGIFRPDSGEIYMNMGGRKLCLDRSTRGLFAYVPQGNLLFSGTVRDNIIIAKPQATEEEIRHAIYVSGMDEFIDGLPEGLETVLGENGYGLSEGQVQRLSIARAVLNGAPILLLDECTSALDEITEKTVLQRLRSLPDRTCIAVTHRPAAVALSDWHLQMENGTVHCVGS